MKSFSNFLIRIASWKTLLLSIAIYMLFPAFIFKNAEKKINRLAGIEVGVIDLTMGINPERTLQLVSEYGDAGRDYYAFVEMTVDVAYPLAYTFMFGIILTLLFRHHQKFKWFNLLPAFMLIFDYIENIFIILLLKTYPDQNMTYATLCEVFKHMKWITFGLIILLIIIGVIARAIRKSRKETVVVSE